MIRVFMLCFSGLEHPVYQFPTLYYIFPEIYKLFPEIYNLLLFFALLMHADRSVEA